MTYVESGQYVDLSDDMILALGKECSEKNVNAKSTLIEEYGVPTLQEAYHVWQSNERIQSAHLFQVSTDMGTSYEDSPFERFMRETVGSTQKFCKTLKLHSATVLRYASGKTKMMPDSIFNALQQVQYPYLTELQRAQEAWRLAH